MATIDTRGFYQKTMLTPSTITTSIGWRHSTPGSIRFQLYDTVQNFDELIDGLNETIGAFPDWHWEVLEVLFDGDLVTARYADTGTHMGLFQGIEPTGFEGADPGVRALSGHRRSDR